METVPIVPENAKAGQIADIIEYDYGCPREVLERLAAELARLVLHVAAWMIKDASDLQDASDAVEDMSDEWTGPDWLER